MKLFKLYIVFIFFASAISVFPQRGDSKQNNYNSRHYKTKTTGKITGKLSFSNGKPVSFATVYVKGLDKHCMSDENGDFKLVGIPYGEYTVEVKTIEAEPEIVNVKIEQDHVKIPLTLKENEQFNLTEVVVTGKTEAQQIKEKGYAVNVVDTEKAALQTIQSNELLDRTAGVRIRQSGGIGSQAEYNINGLSGNAVRIFIDGIPIRNYGRSFSLSSIPPAHIERIEVYKGVVPVYLSEDALGGAINIVLKKLKDTQKSLSAFYSFGSFNSHQGNIDGSFRDSKTGFTLNASAFYNYTDNSYKVWGEQIVYSHADNGWKEVQIKAKRFHDDYESYGINANLGFTDVKWADRFTVGLLYSDMNKDVQNGESMKVVFGNRRTGQDTKMINLRYDKKDLLVKKLSFNSFISYTHANRWVVDTIPNQYNWKGERVWKWKDGVAGSEKEPVVWKHGGGESGEAGRATLAENKEKTIAARSNLSYMFHPRHQLTAHYFYNRFTRDVEDPLLPKAEQELTETRILTKQILGLTYENNFFNDRLKSSLFYKHYLQSVKLKDPEKGSDNEYISVEYDKKVDYDGYGLALSYEVIPRVIIQTSYEKTIRMPESNELLGNTSENTNPNYNLEPEKSHNINLGFLLGPFNFDAHQLRTNTNFFIRDIGDLITKKELNTDGISSEYENLNKIISRGFDAEINYIFKDNLFINYNVSLFNARLNSKYTRSGAVDTHYKDRLRNAPYFTMNGNAEYVFHNLLQKGSKTSLEYNFGYVHKFRYTWESDGGAGLDFIPTQKVHDFGIVYSFPNNKLALSFNVKNFTDEQIFDNWAQQKPGRAFYGKITYKIF